MSGSILNHVFKSKPEARVAVEPTANVGEEMRRLMHRSDVENIVTAATPFLVGSAMAWPAYWLYRGFEWSTVRGKETLPLYIRKTFFQAKVFQFAVLSAGLLYVLAQDTPSYTAKMRTV